MLRNLNFKFRSEQRANKAKLKFNRTASLSDIKPYDNKAYLAMVGYMQRLIRERKG